MNYSLVSRLLSVIMLILSLAFGLCFTMTFFLDTPEQSYITRQAFIASAATALSAAALLFWMGRGYNKKFFNREALCVIGIGWILASFVGAIPYLLILPDAGIANSLFESTSGLTTTGASVFSDLESMPHSLLFWRSLSQWIGGMGVVVFFVAILGFLGVGAKILYANEASGSVADFEESRVQTNVLRLIYIYIGLSVACAFSFRIAGMEWFDAVCHMFATVSTGGFSTRSTSIAAFGNPAIEWVAIVYMILGAVSFLLILRGLTGNFGQLRRNSELIAFLAILAISTTVIFIAHFWELPEQGAHVTIRSATFQVVSIMTTTGFATEDFANWAALPQTLLLALMIIGGCSGSTSGGLKVARVVVVLRLCILSIERSFRSRIVRPIKMNQRILSDRASQDVVMFIMLTMVVLAVSVPIVSLMEPLEDMDTNLSATHACLFNIGPGFADVGPMENYGFFNPFTKLFLSLLMIMGRLELYAVLVLFLPSFWRRFS